MSFSAAGRVNGDSPNSSAGFERPLQGRKKEEKGKGERKGKERDGENTPK